VSAASRALPFATFWAFAATAASAQTDHVPPDPSQTPLPDNLSHAEMMRMMDMDDTTRFGKVLFDQLEARRADGDSSFAWNADAWYGGDYDKLWAKTEGEHSSGDTRARIEALWDHTLTRWWSVQSGARLDVTDRGPNRGWAAIGLRGLAPHWFEVEGTFYLGGEGRTALRLEAEYELLLTQRLILQPDIELNAYGKSDPDAGIDSGLSDAQFGLRLRYEFRRELAPYAGLLWTHRFHGSDDGELSLVAGLRVWW
jgi:copper resistance protein B